MMEPGRTSDARWLTRREVVAGALAGAAALAARGMTADAGAAVSTRRLLCRDQRIDDGIRRSQLEGAQDRDAADG